MKIRIYDRRRALRANRSRSGEKKKKLPKEAISFPRYVPETGHHKESQRIEVYIYVYSHTDTHTYRNFVIFSLSYQYIFISKYTLCAWNLISNVPVGIRLRWENDCATTVLIPRLHFEILEIRNDVGEERQGGESEGEKIAGCRGWLIIFSRLSALTESIVLYIYAYIIYICIYIAGVRYYSSHSVFSRADANMSLSKLCYHY